MNLFALLLTLAASPEPRRIAVVVGANAAAEGRNELRYAYKDAEKMAAVLREAGRFAADDVHVMHDPTPSELLWMVDGALAELKKEAGETLFVLYYSGHSDQSAVYPSGVALPLKQLRARLDSASATVRVGVIDACRGGSWTRAKGLTPDVPFQVDVPFGLSSEGSVLISSSSGAENAHESDALEGSFFTHHLVAGLRGAADRSGDGDVSLTEAFGYAQELTVRDSALAAKVPQHPSFDMNLHGRTDLSLTRAASAPSIVSVTQTKGPIEVVQLGSGLVVLEMNPGTQTTQIALPPGRYMFRRRAGDQVFASEVMVTANSSAVLNEGSLVLVGKDALVSKGFEVPVLSSTTLPAHTMEVRLAVGLQQGGDVAATLNAGALVASFSWALTDRLQVSPFSVAYRFGDHGGVEWVPYAGAFFGVFGFASTNNELSDFYLRFSVQAGLAGRFWVAKRHAINATVEAASFALIGGQSAPPRDWYGRAAVGYSGFFFSNRLSVNVGVAYNQYLVLGRSGPRGFASAYSQPRVSIGSVQSIGVRQLPLIGVQLTDWLTLEAHAAGFFDPYGLPGVNLLFGAAFTF